MTDSLPTVPMASQGVQPYYQDEKSAALCECGCGQPTPLAKQTFARRGVVKGQPVRFVSGHNLRGLTRSESHKRGIAEGQRRAWATKRKRKPVGSTNHDHHGYVRVKTRASAGRWDKQHVLVMEQVIGRRLFPDEVVHHINSIRSDNRPENLHLFRNGSEHNKAHGSFDRLLTGLLADGIVRFNRQTGQYERC